MPGRSQLNERDQRPGINEGRRCLVRREGQTITRQKEAQRALSVARPQMLRQILSDLQG